MSGSVLRWRDASNESARQGNVADVACSPGSLGRDMAIGMRFGTVPPMAFRDLAEASKERAVFSYRAGAASAVSVVAPSLIFEELEIQRVREILQKPPVVPSPLKTLNLN